MHDHVLHYRLYCVPLDVIWHLPANSGCGEKNPKACLRKHLRYNVRGNAPNYCQSDFCPELLSLLFYQ